MYLGGVNRGIAFTKAGFYVTGLIVVLGFFATGSGYNGLYLAVGFGLSCLVVSGMLSERNIRPVEFHGLSEVIAEADTPFAVRYHLSNTSRVWSIFGLESLILDRIPKFRLLDAKIPAVMEARTLVLSPGETQFVTGRCSGLPRGWYREFVVVQRTLFPFGMICKFKVAKFPANVLVRPKRDPQLAGALSYELNKRLPGRDDEQTFYSHRRATEHEPPHSLDWKKNAGRPTEEWLVKTYESAAREHGFWIDADWSATSALISEEAYEETLSSLATACEVLHQTGRPIVLGLGQGRFAVGYETALAALASAPRFSDRSKLPGALRGAGTAHGWFLRLQVQRGKVAWDKSPAWVNQEAVG